MTNTLSLTILNLTDYTIWEHIFFATGCLMWVFTYFIVINTIRKQQFSEIPIIAVCANFAWEFYWSWVFMTDMGDLYVWGYRIWFFLDCFIVYGMFRYGWKQLLQEQLVPRYHTIFLFGLASWFFVLYFFIQEYDFPVTKMGAYSGYVLNVMMSALYIPLFTAKGKEYPFSLPGGWLKGVGTFLISIFCFLKFPDDWFLLSMCIVTAILDFAYITLLMRARKG